MTPVVLPLPDNTASAERLAAELRVEHGYAVMRRIPDGETSARVQKASNAIDVSVLLAGGVRQCMQDREG